MKAQKISMFILGCVALILLVVVAENWGKLRNVDQSRHKNEEELVRLATEITKESQLWEEYHNGIGSMQKASASYEAIYQKEDRAEAVKASMEEVIAQLNAQEFEQNAQRDYLRAVWESLCDQMNIAYETEEHTEPEGDYDE